MKWDAKWTAYLREVGVARGRCMRRLCTNESGVEKDPASIWLKRDKIIDAIPTHRLKPVHGWWDEQVGKYGLDEGMFFVFLARAQEQGSTSMGRQQENILNALSAQRAREYPECTVSATCRACPLVVDRVKNRYEFHLGILCFSVTSTARGF